MRLAGAGRCRLSAERLAAIRTAERRRLRRYHENGLRPVWARALAAGAGGLSAYLIRLGRESDLVLPEPARPEHADRHHVFVVVDGETRGLPANPPRRVPIGRAHV